MGEGAGSHPTATRVRVGSLWRGVPQWRRDGEFGDVRSVLNAL